MISLFLSVLAGVAVYVYLNYAHKDVVVWLSTDLKQKPSKVSPAESSASILKERLAKAEPPSDMLQAIKDYHEASVANRGELLASLVTHYSRMKDDELLAEAGDSDKSGTLLTLAQFLQKVAYNTPADSASLAPPPTAVAGLITRLRGVAYKITSADPDMA